MILYLETNYVVGAAVGRDTFAENMFLISPSKLRLALPSVSIMEAWSFFEGEQKRRGALRKTLNDQIGELRRDETSAHAKALLQFLQRANEENGDLLNDIERRLRDILGKLTGQQASFSAAELLPLTEAALSQSLTAGPTKDPTDNLILAVILDHAKQNPHQQKALLSENSNDFGTPEVRALLSSAGITEYFTRTESFLGWFQAQEDA